MPVIPESFHSEAYRPARLVVISVVLAALFGCGGRDTEERQDNGPIVEVSSEIACNTCRIDIRRMVTLGEDADELDLTILGNPAKSITMTSDGYFYVAPFMSATRGVFKFDPSGRYIGQIGRFGDGPGAYRGITSIALGENDTLYVFAASPRRLIVFSAEGEYVRSSPLPLDVEMALVMPDGAILAMGNWRVPERIGLPIHLLTTDGDHIHSFGAEDPYTDGWDLSRYRRHLSLGLDNFVWSSPEYPYEIERWDLEGRRQETITRKIDGLGNFFGGQQDEEGLLWLLAVVPNPDLPPAGAPSGRKTAVLIEVIDPVNGRLLAQHHMREYSGSWPCFIGPRTMATKRTLESGLIVYDIWQLRLER